VDPEERLALVLRGAEEVVTEEELRTLLETKEHPRAYIGLEPSGLVHIALIIVARKLTDLQEAGFHTILLLADWHAYINDKLGGSMENIRACGEYFRDCFRALGVDGGALEVVYASDLVDSSEYWRKVIDVSKNASIARIKRALTIMGRKEEEAETDASMLIYPAMQVADIFHMELDLALGGIDQRHAHMLLRDVAPKMGREKVVALHTPLLGSLLGGGRMDAVAGKMSKSKPEAAVLLTDSTEEVARKVRGAFCPPEVEGNPVLDMWRLIILPGAGQTTIPRAPEHGGDLPVDSYAALEGAYASGDLHPADLKAATSAELNGILDPVREYFTAHPENLRRVEAIVGG
jgi:tyrosyl-tRNA synthetase